MALLTDCSCGAPHRWDQVVQLQTAVPISHARQQQGLWRANTDMCS